LDIKQERKINNLINLLLREENKIFIRKTISLRIYLKNKVNLKDLLTKIKIRKFLEEGGK